MAAVSSVVVVLRVEQNLPGNGGLFGDLQVITGLGFREERFFRT